MKPYVINLDFKKELANPMVKFTLGDKCSIEIHVFDEGEEIEVDNATISINGFATKPIDVSTMIYTFGDEIEKAGFYRCNVQVYKDGRNTTCEFSVQVLPDKSVAESEVTRTPTVVEDIYMKIDNNRNNIVVLQEEVDQNTQKLQKKLDIETLEPQTVNGEVNFNRMTFFNDDVYMGSAYADRFEVTGMARVEGPLIVEDTLEVYGDIIQRGSAYETHAEQIYTAKDEIIMREHAINALPPGVLARIKALKYDGTNNGVFGIGRDGFFRVGDEGNEAILAAIDEMENIQDGELVYYDKTANKLKSITTNEILEKATPIFNELSLTDINHLTNEKEYLAEIKMLKGKSEVTSSGIASVEKPIIVSESQNDESNQIQYLETLHGLPNNPDIYDYIDDKGYYHSKLIKIALWEYNNLQLNVLDTVYRFEFNKFVETYGIFSPQGLTTNQIKNKVFIPTFEGYVGSFNTNVRQWYLGTVVINLYLYVEKPIIESIMTRDSVNEITAFRTYLQENNIYGLFEKATEEVRLAKSKGDLLRIYPNGTIYYSSDGIIGEATLTIAENEKAKLELLIRSNARQQKKIDSLIG